MFPRIVEPAPLSAPPLIGASQAITALRREIECAARTTAKVLVLGETGVGKDIVAQMIHAASVRRRKRFVTVNCSGIPETLLASELFGHARGSFTGAYRDTPGLVQQANRGTLFLDELGEMSLAMQAMLLRFTESGEVQPVGADQSVGHADVRLITATNRDLRAHIEEGEFREDLFYRLNVIQIRIPPLRERCDDIPLLFRHFLDLASRSHRLPEVELTDDAEQLLRDYAWPGNVRELRNMTERCVLRDRRRPITADQLRPELLVPNTAQPVPASAVTAMSSGVDTDTSNPAVPSRTADRLWNRLMQGDDFWNVVRRPYRAREITQADLLEVVDRGLRRSRGSYRALVRLFNLPPTDYKRFHAFLYQQNCNPPVAPYRYPVPSRDAERERAPAAT